MKILSPQTVALICFALMLILHLVSALIKGRAKGVFVILNILLHIVFIVPLAMVGCSTEEGALLYMISLFVYVSIFAVKYKINSAKMGACAIATVEESGVSDENIQDSFAEEIEGEKETVVDEGCPDGETCFEREGGV